MTINIPLSTELLKWWISNANYDSENCGISAPLPIRLDFGGGKSIELGDAGVRLACDGEGYPEIKGYVGVSSSNEKAQARMLGLEYMRDKVEFQLTDEEKRVVALMFEAAGIMAWRAVDRYGDADGDQYEEFTKMFDNTKNPNK